MLVPSPMKIDGSCHYWVVMVLGIEGIIFIIIVESLALTVGV